MLWLEIGDWKAEETTKQKREKRIKRLRNN
jgi:hypothetical protein